MNRFTRAVLVFLAGTAALVALAAKKQVVAPDATQYKNSLGIQMLRVPAGAFRMGEDGRRGEYDERPAHDVTLAQDFFVSQTEVTVAQFAEFRADAQDIGLFSPYATGMSWQEAVLFCEWLSRKEELPYRLPTEAEWEYAAKRAGSFKLLNFDSSAPEWVADWYGPYSGEAETDPVGPASGWARVVRGGGIMGTYSKGPSGWMPAYRRVANRASIAPGFSGRHGIGFRLVMGALPKTAPGKVEPKLWQQFVKQAVVPVVTGPNPTRPWFKQRAMLPIPPENADPATLAAAGLDPAVMGHNHSAGAAVMPNGDILEIAFSADSSSTEYLPNTTFVAYRRRFGSEQWDMPTVFYDFADVNDQSALLWNDGGKVRFFGGGAGLDGVPFRAQESADSGRTWTAPELPLLRGPVSGYTPQPITNAFRGRGGRMYVSSDGIDGESLLWASEDGGKTWADTLGRTGGRHTTFVTLRDGSILGMGGKNSNIDGFMPRSISKDGGKTWTVSKTQFPALGSNQRPMILRLRSGNLLFASDWQDRRGKQPESVKEHGAFVALSADEGKTWKTRTITQAMPHEAHVTPQRMGWAADYHEWGTFGYVNVVEGQDGLIHVLTSMNHPSQEFEFNEAWILAGGAAVADGAVVRRVPGGQKFKDLKPEASWGGGQAASGQYLLDGPETWYYPNGSKQYEVTWKNGRKVGSEVYRDDAGQIRWEWVHEGGVSTWKQYWANGKPRHVSTWKAWVAEGPAEAFDREGNSVAKFEFVKGAVLR